MHKNVFSYFIGVCLSCLELLFICKMTYIPLLIIFGSVLIAFSLFFVIIKKNGSGCLKNDICADVRKNHFLWIYDEEHSDFLTTVFTCAKVLLFIAYASVLLIPVGNMSVTIYSVLPLIMLILTIYLKTISSKYTGDDYKIASWENSLSDNERYYLYKGLHSFMTMAVLPILTLCFYGGPIVRCAGPFVIIALLGWASTAVSKLAKSE